MKIKKKSYKKFKMTNKLHLKTQNTECASTNTEVS